MNGLEGSIGRAARLAPACGKAVSPVQVPAPVMPPASIATYRFSAGAMPREQELAGLWEILGRNFAEVEFEALPRHSFSLGAKLQILPGLSIVSGFCAGAVMRRTPALVSGGNNDFIFGIVIGGTGFLLQRRRQMAAGPGDGLLISCSEEWTLAFPDKTHFIGVQLPHDALSSLIPEAGTAPLRLDHKETQALRLLRDYLSAMNRSGVLSDSASDLEVGRVAAAHVQHLVALALSSAPDRPEPGKRRCLPVVRLRTIQKDIESLLGEPELSVDFVAARHGVTPRYVQMLFEAKGTTFSRFVLSRRLAHARQRLTDPAYAGRTVTDIALEAGFSDLSYFNRTFRRRYGAAPSSMRSRGERIHTKFRPARRGITRPVTNQMRETWAASRETDQQTTA